MSKVTLGLRPRHRHTDRKQWPCPRHQHPWPGETGPRSRPPHRHRDCWPPGTARPVTGQQSCRRAQPQLLPQGTVMDLPTLTNPARPNPRHLTTEPCNPRLEGPGRGTREGGDLATVTQHLTAHVCGPSGLCWRSENQATSVHSPIRRQGQGQGQGLPLPSDSSPAPSPWSLSLSLRPGDPKPWAADLY